MNQILYIGVVESRQDPLKLGRCKVRVVGVHTEDVSVLPTDKLPWAIFVQDPSSAGISGLGKSPTGLVKGSTVCVMFADIDQQQPFILGVVGGIPQQPGNIETSDDNIILIKDSDGELPQEPELQEATSPFKPAKQYTEISDKLLDFIKQEESLKLTAYQDTGGVWTVGYGTTRINGNPVLPGLTITQEQAEEYLKTDINNDAADAVRKNVSVLITQSMFDALTSFTYNIGRGNFFKSELRTTLNGGNYIDAAGLFVIYNKDSTGKTLNGLTNRRIREKNLFLEDGVYINGKITLTPVDEDNSPGIENDNIGFKDPDNVYPLYRNEPDTNRLARHEQIDKTIVRRKEVSRERNIPIAGGGTWDQPSIPYNTEYPYNQVYETESGHILEFDDTKNSERIHLYHRKGTFTEIDANGTQVNRIVGDGYQIFERNGYVHINGACNVTIDGANNVIVGGALNLEVTGKTTVNIYNNVDMNVSGSANISVKETTNLKSNKINLEANNIDITGNLKVTGNVDIKADEFTLTADVANYTYDNELHTMIGGDVYNRHDTGTNYSCPSDPPRDSGEDCSDVDTAGTASTTGLATPANVKTPEVLSFVELFVNTRGAEAALQYETPEDGDATTYTQYQVDKGLIEEEDLDSGTDVMVESLPPTIVEPVDTSCDIIFGMEEFQASLQLSKYFTLGALTKDGTRKPINQFGLTKQEIVCNLKKLSVNCLDVIYDMYPNMIITSGFRRPGDAKNSSPRSQHYQGVAADIYLNGYTREQHYEAVKRIQQALPYDQLILEYSGAKGVWIHVSFKDKGNRKQIFTMRDHKRVSEFGEFKLIV